MRIGIVGGVERNEVQYQELAEREGHTVEFHGGHMNARGMASLESLIERSDMVVVITDVNSHGAVQTARKLLRQRERPLVLLRRCGTSRFRELLRDLRAVTLGAA